ncbi:MAG TPA: fimbria/pilus periplasmic chaperone [Casimicrobiaceae bacterium]|jgi:fimbrial chaperone protein|nr:fimbria/pilus periplasmic chaperone [Casimicrobiaceae bacterium]
MMRLALAFLLLAATAPALAGKFSVAPIRVDFAAGLRIGAVTVTSEDDHPLVFKNSPSLWTQDADGGDVYTPTSDLVVTPPLLRVEAGEPRIVRIGTLRDPGEVERSYRVFLEEQAPANPEGTGATIAVVIKFGVPVFVAPRSERVAGTTEIVERKPGRVTLQIKNTGNVHFNVEAITANGVAVKDVSSWYLLPGTTRRYDLAIPPDACTGAAVDIRVQATRAVLTASAAASDVCQR